MNIRYGEVGLFYKNSLGQYDIGVELQFGREKILFTVLYRTPSFNHASPECQVLRTNFENLYSNIKTAYT